jgi:hypothetical protein
MEYRLPCAVKNNLVDDGHYDDNLLNVHECESNGQKYKIVRYNKKNLTVDTIPTYGLCRSLIFNGSNKLVGFAPPKSVGRDKFHDLTKNITAEEFVEGTMINVFWNESWEISTRSKVGANTSFFRAAQGKTFRTLFFEACEHCNLDIERLNKELCYSFVLQHPENRIVVPFTTPDLFLTAVYKINSIDLIVHSVSKEDFDYLCLKETTVKFPTVYGIENFEDLMNKYASATTPYHTVGVVLHNTMTGERTKIRNPVYEHVKQLRGNQPKIQYQYLSLRKEGRITEFIKYFPEFLEEFTQFRKQLYLFTKTLYAYYASCYILKERPLGEFLSEYKTHMYHLHKQYQEKKERINYKAVVDYVNNLHPSLLMFSLNYHFRT